MDLTHDPNTGFVLMVRWDLKGERCPPVLLILLETKYPYTGNKCVIDRPRETYLLFFFPLIGNPTLHPLTAIKTGCL